MVASDMMSPRLSLTVPSKGVCWSGSVPGESGGGGLGGGGLGGWAFPHMQIHGEPHWTGLLSTPVL